MSGQGNGKPIWGGMNQQPLDPQAAAPLNQVLHYPDSSGLQKGQLNELFLYVTNETSERIAGYLTLAAPPGWDIEPGELLVIAVRPGGTAAAEFYLQVPEQLGAGPHRLTAQIETRDEGLLVQVVFDLDQQLAEP